jgi:hypothetical protein
MLFCCPTNTKERQEKELDELMRLSPEIRCLGVADFGGDQQ